MTKPDAPKAPKPSRTSKSVYDPTGIDDGTGGIPIGTRRPALRATAWISLIVVAIAIAALAWRQMERQAIERAYGEGVRALAEGRNLDARVSFDRVIAKRPDWAAAWRQRGYAAAEPADAIADFTKAIELDAADADAYAARGRAWIRARQPAKGADDLTRAIDLATRSNTDAATLTTWRADRGQARAEAGNAGAALDDLRHAAQARDTAEDHRRLALALAASGDYAGARSSYDRAITASAPPAWLGERAWVLVQLGEDDAAGVDLIRCAQLEATCAETHGARVGALARSLGRTPPAGAR